MHPPAGPLPTPWLMHAPSRPAWVAWGIALVLLAPRLSSAGQAVATAGGKHKLETEHWRYIVEPGDTLIGLQGRFMRAGSSWRELQKINRVRHPRRLQPGSSLYLPLALLREQRLAAEVVHAQGAVTLERDGQSPPAFAWRR